MTEQDEHKAKMERLKASVDRRIEAAQEERGVADCLYGRRQGEDHRCARDGDSLSRPWHEGRDGAIHQGRDRYGRGTGAQVVWQSSHLSSHGRRVIHGKPKIGIGTRSSPNKPGPRSAGFCTTHPMRWSFSMNSISPSSMTMSDSKTCCRFSGAGLPCSMWSSPAAAPKTH